MIPSIEELKNMLKNSLKEAENDARESHKSAMNSYGAGYDRGMVDAYKAVIATLEDK